MSDDILLVLFLSLSFIIIITSISSNGSNDKDDNVVPTLV